MAVYRNGAVCNDFSENIDELQYLNQASAGTNPQLCSTLERTSLRSSASAAPLSNSRPNPEQSTSSVWVSTSESSSSPLIKGLSSLVDRIDTSGRCNKKDPGSRIVKRQTSLKRKESTITHVQVLVDGPTSDECIPQTPEPKRPRKSLGASSVAGL